MLIRIYMLENIIIFELLFIEGHKRCALQALYEKFDKSLEFTAQQTYRIFQILFAVGSESKYTKYILAEKFFPKEHSSSL